MTSPEPPSTVRPVAYKGEPLDAGRGPGLGCFRFQLGLLLLLLVLTPLSVSWDWPVAVSAALLLLVLVLLLFAGQTVIFLLRLVAADRREGARHRPLASPTMTVGELDDAGAPAPAVPPGPPAASGPPSDAASRAAPDDPGTTHPGMRE